MYSVMFLMCILFLMYTLAAQSFQRKTCSIIFNIPISYHDLVAVFYITSHIAHIIFVVVAHRMYLVPKSI